MSATYLTVEEPREMAQVVTLESADAGRLQKQKYEALILQSGIRASREKAMNNAPARKDERSSVWLRLQRLSNDSRSIIQALCELFKSAARPY